MMVLPRSRLSRGVGNCPLRSRRATLLIIWRPPVASAVGVVPSGFPGGVELLIHLVQVGQALDRARACDGAARRPAGEEVVTRVGRGAVGDLLEGHRAPEGVAHV